MHPKPSTIKWQIRKAHSGVENIEKKLGWGAGMYQHGLPFKLEAAADELHGAVSSSEWWDL
jgi:hypothetical protein